MTVAIRLRDFRGCQRAESGVVEARQPVAA